ncbi:hypothetical protein [Mesorhizobium marinum]|uniref:Uncharacterized protein n=1 Tax=Mesorhizobium marinum TaxID=3228790 RepID=A0ABV3R1Z2_9HYPH
MNLAMQLTMDGMIRALRLKMHALGEDREEIRNRAVRRNAEALVLLSQEARRTRREVGHEPGR